MTKKFAIIGAGPVGNMQALLLATLYPFSSVEIFEEKPDYVSQKPATIKTATIEQIINALKLIKENDVKIRDAKEENESEREFSKRRILLIEQTTTFLKEHFAGIKKSITMPAATLSHLLKQQALNCHALAKDYAKELGYEENKFNFNYNSPVTTDDIKALLNDSDSDTDTIAASETATILKSCEAIFACDGAQSKVRYQLFNEEFIETPHDLTHKIEIKIHKNPGAVAILPKSYAVQVSKDAFKMFKGGVVHYWDNGQEGEDETISLNVFVTRAMYKNLQSDEPSNESEEQKVLSRLIDLPPELQRFCLLQINPLLKKGSYAAETLQMTAKPLHIMSAVATQKQINEQRILLAGEAATGVLIEDGINVGFISNIEQTLSYYNAEAIPESEESLIADADTKIKRACHLARCKMKKFQLVENYDNQNDTVPRIEPELPQICELEYEELLRAIPTYSVTQATNKNKQAIRSNWIYYRDYFVNNVRRLLQAKKKPDAYYIEMNKILNASNLLVAAMTDDKSSFADKKLKCEQFLTSCNKSPFNSSLKGYGDLLHASYQLIQFQEADSVTPPTNDNNQAMYGDWIYHLDCFVINLRFLLQGKKNTDKYYIQMKELLKETNLFVHAMTDNISSIAYKKLRCEQLATYCQQFPFSSFVTRYDDFIRASYRLIQFTETQLAFHQAVAALDPREHMEIIIKLLLLQTSVTTTPTPSNKQHVAILQRFTKLAIRLKEKTLDEVTLENELSALKKELERNQFGSPPLSAKIKAAIGLVVGAIVGFIAGAIVGYAASFFLGGIGAPVGAIVGAMTGIGALGGCYGGFFSGKTEIKRYTENLPRLRDKWNEPDSILDAIIGLQGLVKR